jgi:hypothetical protein
MKMSYMRVASIVGVALCGLAGTALAQSAEPPPPPRVGIEFGFGLYGGDISCENTSDANLAGLCEGVSEAGGIDLHANYFFNPKLGIFVDVFPMVHQDDNFTLTHTVASVGAKWRPVPILTLAGGLGSAQARWKFKGIFSNIEAQTDTVPALFLSAAVEVLRGKSFALDLQARIGVGFYDEDEDNDGEADIKGQNVGFGAAITWF